MMKKYKKSLKITDNELIISVIMVDDITNMKRPWRMNSRRFHLGPLANFG